MGRKSEVRKKKGLVRWEAKEVEREREQYEKKSGIQVRWREESNVGEEWRTWKKD